MKKTYAFLMALFFCVAAAAQGLLPEFSTEDNPVWYRVQFKTGSAFLTDKGKGQNFKPLRAVQATPRSGSSLETRTISR